MMKPLICLSLILFPLISIVEGGSLGGWNPIKDLSDPNLEALAKFAVDEHNKQSKSNLVFVKIVQGKEQVISGKKYDFIITVKNGNGAAKNYEAVVVERVWEHYRSLESFISIVEGGIPGGWNPIKNLSNPNIEALAKFAIDEHNKLSKANLVFVKIVQGKEQVISGMNYDFIIAAKNGNGAAKNYEAVVVERAWEHYKSLESFISVVEGGNFGGWNPIKNLSNPNIEALAKFSIAEHNKQSKANLVFEKIVQGREQVISGKRYDFIIAAKNGNGAAKNYEAVVVERVWEHYRNLESFIYVVESGNLGGWNPIKNLSNPNIEALAKFAIDKHNKQSKANLVFVKIVQGKQQVISGMKYDFIIAAKNENGAIKNYEAVVVERLWEHYRSLESFISIVDGGNLGGWKPIKNLSNPNIEALAKFAIDEYNKQSKANLVFVKIVQGKEQVISGKRYDFIIAAKNGNGEAKNFEAVVVERVWEHYRSLESFISVVGGGSLGGWNPIKNLSNPNIVELAKFAIDAHNKQSKANLMFMKIVKGKQQVISGMKYDFIIAAKNENGAIKNYDAVVVERSWEHYRSLESFKAV